MVILDSRISVDSPVLIMASQTITTCIESIESAELFTSEATPDRSTVEEVADDSNDNGNQNSSAVSTSPSTSIAAAGSKRSVRSDDDVAAKTSTDPITARPAKIMATTSAVASTSAAAASTSTIASIDVTTGRPSINPENVRLVSSLTPNARNWTIRVRVSSKTPVHNYVNSRGSGRLFSFECFDSSPESMIRITAFNEEADRFFPLIELKKVYLIANGAVKKPTSARFNKSNRFEVVLIASSLAEVVPELPVGAGGVPNHCFHFVPLEKIAEEADRAVIDVIAVVRTVGQLETLNVPSGGSKYARQAEFSQVNEQQQQPQQQNVIASQRPRLLKRELAIVDQTGAECRLTLWNDLATGNNGNNGSSSNDNAAFSASTGDIIALKNVMVGVFLGGGTDGTVEGKTLSTCDSTVLEVEPAADCLEEAAFLRSWWTLSGAQMAADSAFKKLSSHVEVNARLDGSFRFLGQLSPRLFSEQQQQAPEGSRTRGSSGLIFSSVSGHVIAISGINSALGYHHGQPILYRACERDGCTKKVIVSQMLNFGAAEAAAATPRRQSYYCINCDHMADRFKWCLSLAVAVADATACRWIKLFQANAEKLLGVSVAELAAAYEATLSEPTNLGAAERYRALLSGGYRLPDYYLRLTSKLVAKEAGSTTTAGRMQTSVYSLMAQSPDDRSRRLLAMIGCMAEQL